MREKRVSIVDVAKLAGVSIATVSRVVNQLGGYSQETAERVRKTIEECGFAPNVNAIGLRTNRSHSIAVIVPKITNEFFAKIVHELDIYLVERGYTLLICDSNEDHVLENMHIKNLIEKNVDGIIYISGQSNIERGKFGKIPVVYIDRAPENVDMLILSDNVSGGRLAAETLIRSGCRNILLMRDLRAPSTYFSRKEGFLQVLAEYELYYDEECEISCFPEYEDAKHMLERTIKSKGMFFDGIFATSDMMAVAALSVLAEAGCKVPQDVKIIGFDNISITRFTNPPITTIAQNTKQLAITAGETILQMIHKKEIINRRMIVPVELINRGTT